MSLDITIKERKEFRCPDCGRLVTTQDIGAILVLVERSDSGDIIHTRTLAVDGEKIKANTYYTLRNGKRVEVK